jgi:hypothetical protein
LRHNNEPRLAEKRDVFYTLLTLLPAVITRSGRLMKIALNLVGRYDISGASLTLNLPN